MPSIDPIAWQRLEQLFAEAVELPPDRRAAFCAERCADDPDLRSELESLLAAHADAASMLDSPPSLEGWGQPPRPELLDEGTRIGVWRIGALINRGGSGEVYFATRDDGAFDQQVALKRLYREAAPDLARFQAERQILASLEHPGIARLLDGGVAPDGRMYAVVEYVDGQPLVDYCATHALDLAARLALFVAICEVVAHAHQNLIVHRDLKPGNILVTKDGRIKLLDFGVAKRIDHVDSMRVDETVAPFTSDYAAPEQLSGLPITTATDVHALGVILFEMLTGTRPWRSDGLPLARIVQQILEREPPAMSAAAAAATAAPIAARLLAGDLDAIVATCLRKDAADRYPTVNALVRDIERHLASEPVVARGRARSYVLGRALKRHRWSIGAAALLVLTLSIGLAATIWEARRAEVERDVAQRAAQREEAVRYELTKLFRSSIAQKSDRNDGPTTAKTMLDRSASRVLTEYKDDPQLAGKVVMTLADLYGALGDVEAQVPLLEGYLAQGGPSADRESIALARQQLASLELMRGHPKRAAELLPLAETEWATAPDKYREQHLEAMTVRGQLLRAQGDLDGSIRAFQAAIAERLAAPGAVNRETASLYNSLGITLSGVNRLDDALAAMRASLDIYAKLGQSDEPDALVILGNTGTLALRTGHLRDAEETLKASIEKQRARFGDSAGTASAMGMYGAALTSLARPAEAVAVLRPAVDMAVKLTGGTSPLVIQDRWLLTDALLADGKLAEAGELSRSNVAAARAQFGEASMLTLRARLSAARIELDTGHATTAYDDFVALVEPLKKGGKVAQPWVAVTLLGCGDALIAEGRPAEAAAPLREAVQVREQLFPAQNWELAQARARLGEALVRSKPADPEGRELLQQSTPILAAELGDDHPLVVRARRALTPT